MNELKNVKHEKFCQFYIETGNASEAYRRSFPESTMKDNSLHVEASRLLSSPMVSLRVLELKAEHRERHNMTVDDLIKELEEARQMGADTESASAMVSATMGKAKLLGLDKQLIDITSNGDSLNKPSIIQLVAPNESSSN